MATSTITPFTVHPTELSEGIFHVPLVISDGNSTGNYFRVMPLQHSSQNKPVKLAALPEHNILWQGGFEVRSKGNLSNYYDELQAHALTCAALTLL